jgi:flavorubredoxin
MIKITNDIYYIGVDDHQLDLFEGQYDVPNGMAYNSYVIFDEKIAVFDTVDANFTDKWLDNLREVIADRTPDYLIVQHMEPDHSANLLNFIKAYPSTKIVGNSKTFAMIANFFENLDLGDNKLEVKDSDTLSVGSHELKFIFAPMVHWPEVMFTYDSKDKVLFSADAFGKFGALDTDEDWACEARRYYFGIVGKYGVQVQGVLKKAAALEINTICPLHGPVLRENIKYHLDLYNTWSSYGVESEGLFIAYTSVYGNTKKAAELLRDKLIEKGCPKVAIADLAREDMAESVEDAFRYGKLVLATTTYNADIFPFMKHFILDLTERGYQNRTIGIIENGSWAPIAAKVIKGMFEKSKNITFTDTTVSIKSAVKAENIAQIEALAEELMK